DVVRKGGTRKLQPRLRIEHDVFVAGTRGDEYDELVEPELFLRRASECDVTVMRRIESAAEQARHWSSSSSSATSTSSPLRAPAALSAASSSSSSVGAWPMIRKPRSVRRMRYRRAAGRGRETRKVTRPSSSAVATWVGGHNS